MKEVLDHHPEIAAHAREAIRRAGLEVRDTLIRGGTDGSRLSFMGLPTPNLFAGEHNFHSRLEWVSVQEMETGGAGDRGAVQGVGGEGRGGMRAERLVNHLSALRAEIYNLRFEIVNCSVSLLPAGRPRL